ncbi:MAG: hypothetical protein IPL67_17465 [Ignavibacteria bacterium]|nr:hypothetical protein [Ignavibacteria bacterium]
MIIKRTITFNLILPVLIAVSLYLCMNFFDWVIDDLYIYFRYVDNFISGNGIVFNKGEYVEGFSSFLWFLYLSLCGMLNLPLEASAKYSGACTLGSEYDHCLQNFLEDHARKIRAYSPCHDVVQSSIHVMGDIRL